MAIAGMAVTCVLTLCTLSYLGIKVPPELNTLTGGLVGSLASMLVKTSPSATTSSPPPNGGGAPAQVQVVNKPENPVPTEETKP